MSEDPTVDELFPLPPGYEPPAPRTGRPPTYSTMWERLMANVSVDEDAWNPCWLWAGKMRGGYPALQVRENGRQRSIPAHREVLLQLGIPLPGGIEADHLCRDPRCIRPCHLDPVPRAVNLSRRVFSTVL